MLVTSPATVLRLAALRAAFASLIFAIAAAVFLGSSSDVLAIALAAASATAATTIAEVLTDEHGVRPGLTGILVAAVAMVALLFGIFQAAYAPAVVEDGSPGAGFGAIARRWGDLSGSLRAHFALLEMYCAPFVVTVLFRRFWSQVARDHYLCWFWRALVFQWSPAVLLALPGAFSLSNHNHFSCRCCVGYGLVAHGLELVVQLFFIALSTTLFGVGCDLAGRVDTWLSCGPPLGIRFVAFLRHLERDLSAADRWGE
ncbi:hypothetical protein HY251_21605 [bacterium]|nr:hypothetical protein [bacterium]